jgi:hypothetical protein
MNINNYERQNRKSYYIFETKGYFIWSVFLISQNHSITQLISFPKKVKKRPCSEINAFMNWDPEYRQHIKFSNNENKGNGRHLSSPFKHVTH